LIKVLEFERCRRKRVQIPLQFLRIVELLLAPLVEPTLDRGGRHVVVALELGFGLEMLR
jgi:hypothetical protein